VRFVSQEVWFDKGFVNWNFLNYCLVQTMSMWSLSIGVAIIFTTNELIDIIRNFRSNTSRFKTNLYEKNTPQARFFWNKMRRRQDLSNKMRRPDVLTKSQWVLWPIDIVCNLFFTNHSSESSSFNSLIDELINLWPAYSTFVFLHCINRRSWSQHNGRKQGDLKVVMRFETCDAITTWK